MRLCNMLITWALVILQSTYSEFCVGSLHENRAFALPTTPVTTPAQLNIFSPRFSLEDFLSMCCAFLITVPQLQKGQFQKGRGNPKYSETKRRPLAGVPIEGRVEYILGVLVRFGTVSDEVFDTLRDCITVALGTIPTETGSPQGKVRAMHQCPEAHRLLANMLQILDALKGMLSKGAARW